jgi:large subunit ribosomal protein L9
MRDVAGLGRHGDVVEVKPGYARNYLLPYRLATLATPHNLRAVERQKKKLAQMAEQRRKELEKIAASIVKHSISIEAAANVEGHLYGSVGAEDIAAAFQRDGYSIEPQMVQLEGPIKELGLYSIKLQLDEGLQTEVKVWVVPTSGE